MVGDQDTVTSGTTYQFCRNMQEPDMKLSNRIFYTGFGIVVVIAVLVSGLKPFQLRLENKSDSSFKISENTQVRDTFGSLATGESLITDLPPVLDQYGATVEGGYTSLEEVTLGGIKQWILIRGADTSKPVLLFLHGGPGGAIMPWVDLFHTPLLEENFVVVHWDQRGAGKSYSTDLAVSDISPEQLVSDTLELSSLLRERFGQEKIFLTGHSWGSALGFMALAQDSTPYHAFIPTSERVAWNRSLIMGFDWAVAQAKANGDVDVLAQLKAIEPFDPLDEADLVVQREALNFYHGEDLYTPGLWDRYLSYVMDGQSPYYTMSELDDYFPGLDLSSKAIERPEFLGDYDLFQSFPKADIPVHFIVGDNDHNTPADLAFEYFEFLDAPAKSFTRIDDAAHMVLWDKPGAWAEALVEIKNTTLANTREGQ
jgi:pimeloyl-ACP methyl ester carboxylesterase